MNKEEYRLEQREIARLRDGLTCQDCHMSQDETVSQYGHTLQVHHLVYRRNGGSDHHSNLVTLCHKCHAKRHTGDVRPRADTKGWTPERLRAIRVEYFGFSQQEMADMLRTPQRTYGDWETKGLPGYVGVTVELLMTPGAMEMIEKGVKA